MRPEEIEKKLALQELFKKALKQVNNEPPENYKSGLVLREEVVIEDIKPPKVREIMTKNTKEKLAKLEKECFKPIVEIDENNLEYAGSKYFGKAWLSNDESWPINARAEYLTFVLQLDIHTLPEKYRKDLGGKGVMQFFFDFDYDGENIIRIVHPNKHGSYHEQPLNNHHLSDYYIEGEKPKQKIISSWEAHMDYPSNQEELDEDMKDLYDDLVDQLGEDKVSVISGDKLGGYALWAQAGESSEGLLYQLSAGAYNEKEWEAHAPILFAGDGTGHIYYFMNGEDDYEETIEDKEQNEKVSFYFDWACG